MNTPQRSAIPAVKHIAKILILLGLVVLMYSLTGWPFPGTVPFLPHVSLFLIAIGLILLKKPEYLALALI
ncbi:hypothetical protein [Methanoregula formicica]|uniref:Uncharacterized protein n=1 Tax=Methanoregula formicica (strain DSM 22288 / NBRC 105244 / SMSP) TaxID=593750 RepID=L0HL69_METFS|nr:hypothetical protein [Methanoregula formicica]AGB03804.1 hypothetical protein Metfor_2821 [Methanoregula formicica SMSP]